MPVVDAPPQLVRPRGPLATLPPAQVEELLRSGVPRSFGAGEVILQQGAASDRVHVLMTGRVRVTGVTADGVELTLALLGPGETVGELAVLDQSPRAATVAALEPVTTIAIDGARYLSALRAHPDALLAVVHHLADRVRDLDRRLLETRSGDTVTRLARELLRLGARYGVATPHGLALDVPLSQEQLASMIGVTRESTSGALRTLRARGAVRTGRMRIHLTDIAALREVASSG